MQILYVRLFVYLQYKRFTELTEEKKKSKKSNNKKKREDTSEMANVDRIQHQKKNQIQKSGNRNKDSVWTILIMSR